MPFTSFDIDLSLNQCFENFMIIKIHKFRIHKLSIMSVYDPKLVKKYLRMKIQNELNTIISPKCIYIDSKILQTLNFIFDFKFEKQILPDDKIFRFEVDYQAIDVSKVTNIVFFIYTGIDYMKTIASMILHNQTQFKKKNYTLFIVPRDNFVSTNQLVKLNVKNKITVKNFDFGFLPIDQDFLSLQLPLQTEDFQVQSCAIDSILRICNINGSFNKIYGRGKIAKNISKIVQKRMQQIPQLKQSSRQSILYVIDRKVDLVTPMMTSYTYGSLVDRFFGITLNRIQIPTSVIHRDQQVKSIWILLNNPPFNIWNTIRSMYIKEVPQYLKKISDELKAKITEMKKQAKGLQDLNNINEQLSGEYTVIQDHRGISAFIIQKLNQFHIINSITLQSQLIQPETSFSSHLDQLQLLTVFMKPQQIIRIVSLSSWTDSAANFFEKYRKSITEIVVNNYSVKDMIGLKTCQQKGFFNRSKYAKWSQLVNKLKLLPQQQHKYTYMHIIYSPLSIRLIELFLQGKMTPQIEKILGHECYYLYLQQKQKPKVQSKYQKVRKNTLIYLYFIGGITEAELDCIRILEKIYQVQIITCTTNLIQGNRLIKAQFQQARRKQQAK